MGNDKNIDAIYIHIPFCSKKCEYCDFCTFINMQKEYRKYVDYLIKEIRMHPEYRYDTIYFGGGTPSLLATDMIKDIMNELEWTENAEITLELNPADMTLEKLSELRKAGVNRLSIGIQSFQDHVLKFIGREHSSEEAVSTYRMAREAGFENITIDLMFGIPNQTVGDLQKDLEIIRELSPENVSIYSLIWEEGTVFWSKLQKGILSEMDQDTEALMYGMIIDFFESSGYIHYEISNFSRIDSGRPLEKEKGNGKNAEAETFENLKRNLKNSGRHNLKYWRNQEFAGVGMSAAGFYGDRRYSNVRTFKKYYSSIDEGKLPIDTETVEIVDSVEREKLKRMLGLRLVAEGIGYFEDEKVEELAEKGMIEIFERSNSDFSVSRRIKLTRKGVFFANDIFMEFI